MGTSISSTIGNLQLKSPLIIGANDLVTCFEDFELIAQSTKYLGAFVTKSFTLNPRVGNHDPIVAHLENNVLVSSGLRNSGLIRMLKEIEQYQVKYASSVFPKLIASIAADPDSNNLDTKDQLTELACRIYESGTDAIELNLSCPNLNNHEIVADRTNAVYEIIYNIKDVFAKKNYRNYTLIAKLAGDEYALVKSAPQAESAGADAITILPLLRATGFYTGLLPNNANLNIGETILGNSHGTTYGSGLGPITRQLTMNLAKIIKIPLIASGGCLCGINNSILEKSDGLIQTMLSGAKLVAAVSAFYPFNREKLLEIDNILQRYEEFMAKNPHILKR